MASVLVVQGAHEVGKLVSQSRVAVDPGGQVLQPDNQCAFSTGSGVIGLLPLMAEGKEGPVTVHTLRGT